MGAPAVLRLAASLLAALVLSGAAPAADYDYPDDDYSPAHGPRRSTWERSTSLTFYRYFEPFPRVDSARACRDQCLYNRRCTGWTYYHADFRGAGRDSYKLQRVCVLGAGIKDKRSGNRPGRTSGVVRSTGRSGGTHR